MDAKSYRYALAAAALVFAVGCGDSAGEDNNGGDNGTPNSNTNANNGANNATPRPDLVEAEGCMPNVTMPNPTNPSQAEIAYMTATENELALHRQEFGAFCGSALPVDIDWTAVFSSRGFDDDEEVGTPGAVADAVTPFLNTTQTWCNGRVPSFYEVVSRVIISATDSDDRIGLCWEEATTTLVYRVKLDPDATTATTATDTEITDWLDMTL